MLVAENYSVTGSVFTLCPVGWKKTYNIRLIGREGLARDS